ncbi:hypothetical protein BJ165DRAFT_1452448 [Panaeolus papilionaceus]|nr:hypothetical protein BJ165DRAFT_1452448 [Panaeolus papilionaceus]
MTSVADRQRPGRRIARFVTFSLLPHLSSDTCSLPFPIDAILGDSNDIVRTTWCAIRHHADSCVLYIVKIIHLKRCQ